MGRRRERGGNRISTVERGKHDGAMKDLSTQLIGRLGTNDAVMTVLRMSLIINFRHRILYYSIPKCGAAMWRRLMRRINGVENWGDHNAHRPHFNGLDYLFHLTPAAGEHAAEAMRSFVTVRSPFASVLSAWLDRSTKPEFVPWILGTFQELLRWLQGNYGWNEHWTPVSKYCGFYATRYGLIAKLENVAEWGPTLVTALGLDDNVAANLWPGPKAARAHNNYNAQ